MTVRKVERDSQDGRRIAGDEQTIAVAKESVHPSVDSGGTRSGAAEMFLPPGETTLSLSTGLGPGHITQEGPDRAQKFPTEQGEAGVFPAGLAPGTPHS